MSPRTLFLDAVENHAPETWPSFLDTACGADEPLRQQVERLLAAHARTSRFMDRPAAPPVASAGETIGAALGRYRLVEQIGEGGMGFVYLAEQTEPIRRQVALKIIRPGLDNGQTIARFEAERQTLALMDHPNIARILDAGEIQISERGMQNAVESKDLLNSEFLIQHLSARPFFVMELVRGLPITDYCEQEKLPLRERIELFITVCHAVQHAHHKGVIHRDLKPSNILITTVDGRPVPKVIDFGVAKATAQKLTERTMSTEFGQVIGTLEYMSPEQAELNQLDIDTRSDIYSLGVLLYELLTGTTPFEKQKLRTAAFHEMLRIIREEEPETVSVRLAKTRRVGSAHRQSAATSAQPHPLTSHLYTFQELDWIVSKSLEKDRSRRYESASALAADIERYLNDEPVQACPPSHVYRLRKLFWRYKGSILGIAAVAIALLVAAAVSFSQASLAKHARGIAEANHKKAEHQTQLVELERELAAQKAHANSQVLSDVLNVFGSIFPQDSQRRSLLASVRSLDKSDSVAAFYRIGSTFVNINDYAAAVDAVSHGMSIDSHDPLLCIARGDVYFRQGNFEAAAKDYSSAIEYGGHTDVAFYRHGPFAEISRAGNAYILRGFARCGLQRFHLALNDFQESHRVSPLPTLNRLLDGLYGMSVSQAIPHEESRNAIVRLVERTAEQTDRDSDVKLAQCGILTAFDRPDEARTRLTELVRLPRHSNATWFASAVLALKLDLYESYLESCHHLLLDADTLTEPDRVIRAAWACALATHTRENERAIAIVKRAYQRSPGDQQLQLGLAALLYRAGEYDEAREQFEAALAKADLSSASFAVPATYLAAMNHCELGQISEASRWFEQAERQTLWELNYKAHTPPWHRRIVLEILRAYPLTEPFGCQHP